MEQKNKIKAILYNPRARLFVSIPRAHTFRQVDVNERSALGCLDKEDGVVSDENLQ